MKLILSRKGFDSANGAAPSPILADGTICSLPIPAKEDAVRLGQLRHADFDLPAYVDAITRGRIGPDHCVHLDPDIDPSIIPRPAGWQPALGQSGAAQSHLARQGVGPGDLFLFYGWFRESRAMSGTAAPADGGNRHLIYGWLQVGSVWNINAERERLLATHPGVASHPHLAPLPKYLSKPNNVLYVAAANLRIPGVPGIELPGAGPFRRISPARTLTAPQQTRRHWRLPKWFMHEGRARLSYHANPARWTDAGDSLMLQSAAIGQEFVLELPDGPEPADWLRGVFATP